MKTNLLEIENVHYIKCSEIGRGSYGAVYEGVNEKTQERVAIKEQQCLADFELQLLTKMKSQRFKNLANVYALEKKGRFTYVVMELCNEGSLFEKIQKQTLEPKDIRYVMKEVSNGIKELHDLGYAHRDIKPENILIKTITDNYSNKQEKYKLCDFGTAKGTENVLETQKVGTPYYLAPEQLNEQNQMYDKSVDIWAFGAVCYELLIGTPLFNGYSEETIKQQILTVNIIEKINNLQKLDRKYKNLLCNMLQRDPNKRFGIDKVIQELNSDARSVSRNKEIIQFNKSEQSQNLEDRKIGFLNKDEKQKNYQAWNQVIHQQLIKPQTQKSDQSQNQVQTNNANHNYFQNQQILNNLPKPSYFKIPNGAEKIVQGANEGIRINGRLDSQINSNPNPGVQQLKSTIQQQIKPGFATLNKNQPVTPSYQPIPSQTGSDQNNMQKPIENSLQQQKQLSLQRPQQASKTLQNQQSQLVQNSQEITNTWKQQPHSEIQVNLSQQIQYQRPTQPPNALKNNSSNLYQPSNNKYQHTDHSAIISDPQKSQQIFNNSTSFPKQERHQRFQPNMPTLQKVGYLQNQ